LSVGSRWRLGDAARARGVRLVAFEELASTNDEARRLVDAGERGPLWIVAERQSAGRGRRGRSWISPAGNLYASLVVSGAFGPSLAPQLGFVAGVAMLETLKAMTGRKHGFALKWPNDLLLERAKLGGILLEGVTGPAGFAAVVGIGVNCASAPEGLPYPARALSELGEPAPESGEILTRLSDAFVVALEDWRDGSGFVRIREQWLEDAAGLGEVISVSLAGGEVIRGRCDGIDADGRLIVHTETGRRAIDAGDVYLAHGKAGVLEHPGKDT
jgi:biotin-[acetyl-CoA-carboxylase] ligase BirA-like protein